MAKIMNKKDVNHSHYLKYKIYFIAYGNELLKCVTCDKDIKRSNWTHHNKTKFHLKLVEELQKRNIFEDELKKKMTEEIKTNLINMMFPNMENKK